MNLVDQIQKLYGISKSEALEKIASITVDDAYEIIDAFAVQDHDRIKRILGESHQQYNIGDEVLAYGKEAIVKIPRGPANTIGVSIDGKLAMVRYEDLEKKLDESGDAEIQRMLHLANVNAEAMHKPAPEPVSEPVEQVEENAEDDKRSRTISEILTSFDAIEDDLKTLDTSSAKLIQSRIGKLSRMIDSMFELERKKKS